MLRAERRRTKRGATLLLTAETAKDLGVETLEPLSQRIPVSVTTGQFRLLVDASVSTKSSFVIEATPRDPKALIPSKRFLVPVMENVTAPLELGDFGSPVTITDPRRLRCRCAGPR